MMDYLAGNVQLVIAILTKLKFKLLIPIAILWTVFGIGYGYGWIGT